MTALKLLTTLRCQGFDLMPLPEGKLAVKPAEKLTDDLRQELKQRKAEVLALLQQQESSASPDYRALYQETAEATIPNWPLLLIVTAAPLIGTPLMPAMKVRVCA